MAIYSLEHSQIGRTTHAAGTGGAHIRYIIRRSAAEAVFQRDMTNKPDQWIDQAEGYLRMNGRVLDKLRIALPHEFDAETRVRVVMQFVDKLAVSPDRSRGAPYVAAIHRPSAEGDQRNYHAHIAIHDRDPRDNKRVAGLSDRNGIQRARVIWQDVCNDMLREIGSPERVDHRSLVAQGITDREPTIHLGPAATAMRRRGVEPAGDTPGYAIEPGRLNGSRAAENDRRINAERDRLRKLAEQAAATKVAEAERQAKLDAERAQAEHERVVKAEADRRTKSPSLPTNRGAIRIVDPIAAAQKYRAQQAALQQAKAQDEAAARAERDRLEKAEADRLMAQETADHLEVQDLNRQKWAVETKAWQEANRKHAAERKAKADRLAKVQAEAARAKAPTLPAAPAQASTQNAQPTPQASQKPAEADSATQQAPTSRSTPGIAVQRDPTGIPTRSAPVHPPLAIKPRKVHGGIQPDEDMSDVVAAAFGRKAPAAATPAPASSTERDPRDGNSPRRQDWLLATAEFLQRRPEAERQKAFKDKIPGLWAQKAPDERAPIWSEIEAILRWMASNVEAAKAWAASVRKASGPGPAQQGPAKPPAGKGEDVGR